MQERKTPPASLGFPRAARITRGTELQRIAREGKRIRTTFVEVRIIASPFPSTAGAGEAATRVGLIVPRLGNTAVARNKLKRSLREVVRRSILPAGLKASIVFRVRAGAYKASFRQIAADIEQGLDELKAKSIGHLVTGTSSIDAEQS